MIEDSQAAMPVVQSDAVQAIIGRRPVTLDTLHEIKPVEQHQPGNSQTLIVSLRNPYYRQKIIVIQSGSGRTHVHERGD